MDAYRRNDGGFSRVWRRNRTYTLSQLKHLARRHQAEVIVRQDRIAVMDPRSGRQLASFALVKGADMPVPGRSLVDETMRAYASLRL